jgi:hypothetical protein
VLLETHVKVVSLVKELMLASGAKTKRAPAVKSTAKSEVRRTLF